MNWFKDMKIASKLLISFVVIAIIAGAMGTFGIINMRNIDKDYTVLYTDFGVSYGDLGDVGIDFNHIRTKVNEMLLTDNIEKKEKLHKEILQLDKEIDDNLIKIKGTLVKEDAFNTFYSVEDAIQNFITVREKIIEFALANENEQAILLLNSEGTQRATEADERINELFDVRKKNGGTLSDNLSVQTNMTTITMISVVVLTMLIAIALGIIVSKMIANPIKRLMVSAEKIADGDLDVSIDVKTKDEVGSLAAAFSKMSENLNETISSIQYAAEQVASGSKQISVSSISL